MKASKILIQKIKEFEGFRSTAYKCPAGVWTIGYGHTIGVKRGDTITEEDADKLLRQELRFYESFVEKLHVTCQQHKFDALVDFAFNVGCSALESSTLLKKIRMGKPSSEIRAEFCKWVYATVGGKKRKLKGLELRREWEADRYEGKI